MKYEKVTVKDNDFFYLPVPENYGDCLTLINSDLCRMLKRKKSKWGVIMHMLTHPFYFLGWHRLCAHKGLLYKPCRLMRRICVARSKMDIHIHTRIGYGFHPGHSMCMVINGGTIIGNNVNVAQFMSIGTNHNTPAVIGDNVYIGPGVNIIEDVRIGSGSTIGAGSTVTRDIPAGSTCVGSPAKPLNYENPGRYVKNRYEFTVPEA